MSWSPLDLVAVLKRPGSLLGRLWDHEPDASEAHAAFARRELEGQARSGVQSLASVLLLPYLLTTIFAPQMGLERSGMFAAAALTVLCIHIYFSARAVRDIEALYLLATVLIVTSGTTQVLFAQRTGELDHIAFASVGLLFMAIPTVPWGPREGTVVCSVVYGLFMASTFSVHERFEPTTLWTFQVYLGTFFAICTAVVTRMALLRREDFALRFDLTRARSDLEELSLKDALTGAWNRRFLEQQFPDWAECDARRDGRAWFAIVDLDRFKQENDRYGHAYGDAILTGLAEGLAHAIGTEGFVVRLGGDEFACFFVGDDPRATIERAGVRLQFEFSARGYVDRGAPHFSAGITRLDPDEAPALTDAYKAADHALYRAKSKRARETGSSPIVCVELDSTRGAS